MSRRVNLYVKTRQLVNMSHLGLSIRERTSGVLLRVEPNHSLCVERNEDMSTKPAVLGTSPESPPTHTHTPTHTDTDTKR